MSTKTVEKKDSYYRDVLRKFTAHKLAMIGVAVILLEVILVIVLPMIMKLDPYTSDILAHRKNSQPYRKYVDHNQTCKEGRGRSTYKSQSGRNIIPCGVRLVC